MGWRSQATDWTPLRRPRLLSAWLAVVGLVFGQAGCLSLRPPVPAEALAQRILPPPLPLAPELADPGSPEKPEETPSQRPVLGEPADDDPSSCPHQLTLDQAFAIADVNNPRLMQMRARVDQARAGQTIAFAEFLPQANTTFRTIQGTPAREKFALPTLPTSVGNVAFGGASDAFRVAELHVQWTVYDFGRTSGRYGQALAAGDIAELQFQRARQTVSYNVTAAYLGVLRAQALRVIADKAVERAESVLRDARNFLKRGNAIRNDVLRAEVLLAEARLTQVSARTAVGVAVAGLNQEMGINVSTDTQVAIPPEPELADLQLPAALQLAADNRLEFRAALRTVSSARLGQSVARADFLPKVVVGGTAAQQDGDGLANAHLLTGGVGLELNLFEGGKRLGRLRSARAEVGVTIGQAQEICDRIAYEVDTAYLAVLDARQRIDLASTAARQSAENLRVVRKLFDKGDATPTEVVDADLALVRAQENEAAAIFDYQTAVARLSYAVGVELAR